MKNVGIDTKWKVISQDGKIWTHVYPLVRINGTYKPLDLTIPLPYFSEVRGIKSRIYSI